MRSHFDSLVDQVGENMAGSLDTLSQKDPEALVQRVTAPGEVYSDDELEERPFELVGPSQAEEASGTR